MKSQMFEIPENQIDIFEMLEVMEETAVECFDPLKANWHAKSVIQHELQCTVLGVIPESVLEPSERIYTDEHWGEQQDTWCAYVWSIAQGIPYKERAKDDINGWLAAMKIFIEVRDKQGPIKLEISEVWADNFKGLEVLEYL